jgi:hypothetical protein
MVCGERMTKVGRPWVACALAGALVFLATGCGQMTIRTWVKVIPDESTASIDILGNVTPIERLQGGMLATVKIDTNQILTGPLHGTIELQEVRIAGDGGRRLGHLCTWANPALPSSGTVTIDLTGGESSADLNLNLKATTKVNEIQGLPPAELAQPAHFDLGSGLSLDSLLAAAIDGSADGLFATRATFEGDSDLGGLPVTFLLDLGVTNEMTPPLFDADLLAKCDPYFSEQGDALFYGLNSKSTYLKTQPGDDPAAPLVIPLADLGAVPGDTLRIARVGTYSDETLLKDGTDTALSGIFSATPDVLPATQRYRVPGAIDAGPDVKTSYLKCLIFPICWPVSTDVPEDFKIGPSLDVVVPSGAAYLIVSPLSPAYKWSDDSGFGFGVDVTVNPTS